ncbi:MAG: N-acetylmuramoyl-L-alanine amidase, partial [Desulfobacterales bacterium]
TKLRTSKQSATQRDRRLGCIRPFQSVQQADPTGPWAAAGLYMSGQLWEELMGITMAGRDRSEALDAYLRVIKRYPKSRYQPLSREGVRRLSAATHPSLARKSDAPPPKNKSWRSQKIETQKSTVAKTQDNSIQQPLRNSAPVETKRVPAAAPAPALAAKGGQGVNVTGLRYWSNPNYTRVVIDADGPTQFQHRLLKKDPSLNKPQRLFVDLAHCRLNSGVQKHIPINDDLLIDARAGQHTTDKVRVVVDIKTIERHKIFALKNPFRIVIDIHGTDRAAPAARPPQGAQPPAGRDSIGDLAKQLALGVGRIVIDPGHGGKDFGAPGYLKGVHEKKITLALARRLAPKLRQSLGCEVLLTRTDDRYLTLEERTAKANTLGADLFISLHTNAHRDPTAHGLETYYLNFATNNEAVLVAARENATSTNNISDLQTILTDLMQNAKINESSKLAAYVQGATYSHLGKQFSSIKSKGVKQAPFYVLLGAQMPSILVETAFISNPRECKRLMDPQYQEVLCEGIVRGVKRYINETTPMARGPMEQLQRATLTKGG